MDQEKAKALFFEGIALFDAADFAGAETKLRAALAIVPDRPSALTNLSAALVEQDKLGEAATVARRAVAVDPASAEAWITLAAALTKLRQPDEALAAAERAVAAAPANPQALMSRAAAFSELRRHDQAVADYSAAARINPEEKNLRGLLVTAKMYACDWNGLAGEIELLLAAVRAGETAVKPFPLLAMPGATAADQLQCARATVARSFPSKPARYRGERYDHERIRIAYLSGDFYRHPVTHLLAGALEQHDHRRFETFGLSFGPDDGSPERGRISHAFDRFIDVRERGDDEVAALIREAEIDIAVDLGGFTSGGRPAILASRPAPIQAAYLGYPGTTGAPYIDYVIADDVIIPPESRRFYSEAVVNLPDSYQANDNRQAAAPTPSRADAGLPERGFVFCSFNNTFKITREVFEVWMKLLAEVDESVLWLIDGNAAGPTNLRREAEARGIEPERLIFAPSLPRDQHLARHRLADLFLDTSPYNAHTTASDALWMGLPLVTTPGETFASRVAASLLTAIGVPGLITQSLNAYTNLALRLARQPAELAAIRATLAAKRDTTALFDTARFTRHLEAAFATMVERQRRGETPTAFAVDRLS